MVRLAKNLSSHDTLKGILHLPSQSEATQTSSSAVMLVSRKNSVVGVSLPYKWQIAGVERGGIWVPVAFERKALPRDRKDSIPTMKRSEISSPDIMMTALYFWLD